MSAFGISDDFEGSIPYPPGSQLASEGPYRHAIEALISKYPILNFSKDFKSPVNDSCIHQLRSQAALYSLGGTNAQNLPDLFDDAGKLQRALDSTGFAPAAGSPKKLLILEDLDPTFVSVIGHEWQVDPRIFMRHQVNGLWNMDHQGTTPIAMPSSINPGTFFNIQYQEMRFFVDELPSEILRTAGNYRNIATTSIGRHRDQTGIVNLKASFWSRKLPQGGWQALLIVDGPLDIVLAGRGKKMELMQLHNEPFQGGYPDPLIYDSLEEAMKSPGPPRTGLFDDLGHYFEHHSNKLDKTDPTCTTYFMKLIVASHYIHVYHYTRGLFDQLEFQLDRRKNFAVRKPEATLQPFWSDLHHFRRRLEYYTRHLGTILLHLGIDETIISPQEAKDPADKNFLHLQCQFRDLEQRSDAIFSSYSVLTGISTSQQGLFEAKAAQNLQYLATVFLPLSFAASLLSMNGQYGPGHKSFWVYVVMSAGMFAIVLTCVLVLRPGTLKWIKQNFGKNEIGSTALPSKLPRAQTDLEQQIYLDTLSKGLRPR